MGMNPIAMGIPWAGLGGFGEEGGGPAQGIPQQLDGRSSTIWGGCRRWGPHPSSSSSLPASAHPRAMGGAAPAPFIIICGQVKCAGNSCSGRLSAEIGARGGGDDDDDDDDNAVMGGKRGAGVCLCGYHPTPSAPVAALGWSVGVAGDGGDDGGEGVLMGCTGERGY